MRMGGGYIEGKWGKRLEGSVAAIESAIYGIISKVGSRVAHPDFGTEFYKVYRNNLYAGRDLMEAAIQHGISGEALTQLESLSMSTLRTRARATISVSRDNEIGTFSL